VISPKRTHEERLAFVQGYANALRDVEQHGLDFAKRTIPLMHELLAAVEPQVDKPLASTTKSKKQTTQEKLMASPSTNERRASSRH